VRLKGVSIEKWKLEKDSNDEQTFGVRLNREFIFKFAALVYSSVVDYDTCL
jgi:hypothetical protein